jgi:hypothetical protein
MGSAWQTGCIVPRRPLGKEILYDFHGIRHEKLGRPRGVDKTRHDLGSSAADKNICRAPRTSQPRSTTKIEWHKRKACSSNGCSPGSTPEISLITARLVVNVTSRRSIPCAQCAAVSWNSRTADGKDYLINQPSARIASAIAWVRFMQSSSRHARDIRFYGRLGNEQDVGDGGIRLSSRTPFQDFYAGLAVPVDGDEDAAPSCVGTRFELPAAERHSRLIARSGEQRNGVCSHELKLKSLAAQQMVARALPAANRRANLLERTAI